MLGIIASVASHFLAPYRGVVASYVASVLPPKNQGGAGIPMVPTRDGDGKPGAPKVVAPSNVEVTVPPGSPRESEAKVRGTALYDALVAKKATPDLIRSFQSAAGIKQDGVYGPITAGALQYFIGKTYTDEKTTRVVPYTPIRVK